LGFWGLVLGVWGFGVWCLGFRVWGLELGARAVTVLLASCAVPATLLAQPHARCAGHTVRYQGCASNTARCQAILRAAKRVIVTKRSLCALPKAVPAVPATLRATKQFSPHFGRKSVILSVGTLHPNPLPGTPCPYGISYRGGPNESSHSGLFKFCFEARCVEWEHRSCGDTHSNQVRIKSPFSVP